MHLVKLICTCTLPVRDMPAALVFCRPARMLRSVVFPLPGTKMQDLDQPVLAAQAISQLLSAFVIPPCKRNSCYLALSCIVLHQADC